MLEITHLEGKYMLGRLANDDVLQRMLTLRTSYLRKFNSLGISRIQGEGVNNVFIDIVLQNNFPQQFQEMNDKLNKTYQLFERAENELAILKTLKSDYENSINSNESETFQKQKLHALLSFDSDVFDKTWEELSSMLPVPRYKAFKLKLKNYIAGLEEISSNTLSHDLLTMYENEKQINSYLTPKVDEILVSLFSFKERYQKFELDLKIVVSQIRPLIHASVARDIKKVKSMQDELITKIKNEAVNDLKQAYTDLPRMDRKHEGVRQQVLTSLDNVSVGSTGKVNSALNNSRSHIASETKKEDFLPHRNSQPSASREGSALVQPGSPQAKSPVSVVPASFIQAQQGQEEYNANHKQAQNTCCSCNIM